MFLRSIRIEKDSFVSEIVREDYRTAEVFKKYGIDFCCGAKWELGKVCEMNKLDFNSIKEELEQTTKTIQFSNKLHFDKWGIDFLTEYITNIHHEYLRNVLPRIKEQLQHFVTGHVNKYPHLEDVEKQFNSLHNYMLPHLLEEEDILFPYIRQISHAYESKESYASLLVRTLRKPVENVMKREYETVFKILKRLRELTSNYIPPKNACVNHQVTFSMLKELDNDLSQHIYLENDILFPRAVAMEKELLGFQGL